MHLATHLMMLMLAVVACRAAFIPNMMFASGRNRQTQQQPKSFPQQQHQQQQAAWRAAAANPLIPWDDGTETYGYLADRHPNAMDDLTPSAYHQPQPQQSQQPLVYGVPHRYLSEPLPNSYPLMAAAASPTDELYNNELYNNALLMRGRGPFNSIKRSGLGSSYYDAIIDDADTNFDDGLSSMASDYYDQPISHQDVVNFEKYVQRYFQQEPSDASDNEAEVENQYVDYWSVDRDSDDAGNNYDIDNDEEAARQLHLLLKQQKQQRRPIALREIQKKSVGAATSITMTTRTEAPVTTATTTTTFSATLAPQSQQGQKEEPLLRPPTPQRQPQQPQQQQQQLSSTTTTTTSTTPSPSAAKKEIDEENNNIYHTIQRLMNMRNRLQKSPGDDERDSSAEDEEDTNNRAKRFVAPSQDSLLSKQIHSLDKIKA